MQVLVAGGKYVSDNADMVLAIHNSFQVDALVALVDSGRLLYPSRAFIPQVTTERQVQAVQIVCDDNVNSLAAAFPTLLKLESDLQVEALSRMVTAGRDIAPSLAYLTQIKSQFTLDALEVLLNAPTTYSVSTKWPALLQFTNSFQVEAVRIITESGRPLQAVIDRLLGFQNQKQIDKLRELVATRRTFWQWITLRPAVSVARFQEALDPGCGEIVLDGESH